MTAQFAAMGTSAVQETARDRTARENTLPVLTAFSAFLGLITYVVPSTLFPSIPGAPGLPIFYVPLVCYVIARAVVTRLDKVLAHTVEQIALLVFAGGCAILCIGALIAPFHRQCVEPVGEDCERYAQRPGADLQSALIWGTFGVAALAVAGIEVRVAYRKRH